jgi:hypothetical protein
LIWSGRTEKSLFRAGLERNERVFGKSTNEADISRWAEGVAGYSSILQVKGKLKASNSVY